MKSKMKPKCNKCYGYGWYPIGDLSPIGEMDSSGWGEMVIKCPWCNAGFNTTNEKYKLLKQIKENENVPKL